MATINAPPAAIFLIYGTGQELVLPCSSGAARLLGTIIRDGRFRLDVEYSGGMTVLSCWEVEAGRQVSSMRAETGLAVREALEAFAKFTHDQIWPPGVVAGAPNRSAH